MMLLWATAGIPLGAYNIAQNFHVALRIQPQILTVLSLATWTQCQYYGRRWSWFKCLAVAAPLALVLGGVELGLVFALLAAKSRDLQWPVILMAVLSASLLSAGVLRHYWDIYRERTVRGISFLFVAIDALGDLTSLVSIFFQPELDVLGMVIYGSELALWLGILACGGYCECLDNIRAVGLARPCFPLMFTWPPYFSAFVLFCLANVSGQTTLGHGSVKSLGQLAPGIMTQNPMPTATATTARARVVTGRACRRGLVRSFRLRRREPTTQEGRRPASDFGRPLLFQILERNSTVMILGKDLTTI